MSVPNDLLAHLMRLDCADSLALDQTKLSDPTAVGLFVCTHQMLSSLQDNLRSQSLLVVDELHELLKINRMTKLRKAKRVFALSATLGGVIGKRKLREELQECMIIDTENVMAA
jgi:superfamily II DNA or RNA helicase